MIRSGNGGPVACAGLRVVAKISGDWCIAKKKKKNMYIYIYIYIYIIYIYIIYIYFSV